MNSTSTKMMKIEINSPQAAETPRETFGNAFIQEIKPQHKNILLKDYAGRFSNNAGAAKKGTAGHPINLIANSNSRPKLEQIITPRATLKRVFNE